MSLWAKFRDEDLKALWSAIDTAYWYPNDVTRDLLNEMIERGIADKDAHWVKRLQHETVTERAWTT